MSDYNSGFTGDRVVELLNMIPNLAKADLSNAMTVSLGKNGYAKFNNGFLIQWGYISSSSNNAYDKSDAVNSFTLAGKDMWLNKEDRVGLVNSINIEKQAGRLDTVLWFDAVKYTIPISSALLMLNSLELYALDCYNVTQQHIAIVRRLQTGEEVESYNYNTGYPNKLEFSL